MPAVRLEVFCDFGGGGSLVVKKVIDDFMVRFIYGEGVRVNVVVLVGEEFEVGEIFSDLTEFLFDFAHALLQFKELV